LLGAAQPAVIAICAALIVASCSQERKSRSEIGNAFADGNYRETVALCRYAIRRNIEEAFVYHYYGMSLVELGRDSEGFARLEEATRLDPGVTRESAEFLMGKARKSVGRGGRKTASRRFVQAVKMDPSLDLGPWRFMVADTYFEVNDYVQAAPLYRAAISAYPDTSVCQEAYFNLARSYAELDLASDARAVLEISLARYPRGRYKSDSRFLLETLLLGEAESDFALGNFETVVELLTRVLEETRNPGMAQRGHFLLGETYEAMGEFSAAYLEYKQVIEGDLGTSGSIVEKARAKMKAFREAGVY
jgi:tetratricopeptide (TPR) repeat protein